MYRNVYNNIINIYFRILITNINTIQNNFEYTLSLLMYEYNRTLAQENSFFILIK